MAVKRDARKNSGGQTFDRTPPQNIEAERSVLGAILLNPDAVGPAVEILQENAQDTFYNTAHQHIYDAIVTLFAKNEAVDAMTVMGQLTKNGQLEAAGGYSYITELPHAVPTSANVEYYAKLVLEAALLRRIISTCTRYTSEAYEGQGEVDDLLDRVEADVFRIAERRQLNPIHKVSELLQDGIYRIEEQMKSRTGITGVPSGFKKLDEMLSGFQQSDMIILAARPSVGKTAFALNVASSACNHAGKSCLIFSLEMAKEQLVQRLLCMEGGVDSSRLRSGFLARAEFPKLTQAAHTLNNSKLFIDDTPNISVLELRSKARRHHKQHPIDLIIIDYLQLMNSVSRAESRQVAIAEISRAVKGIARELLVPVVALSQLSREAEKDESGQPKLSHLRESGAIEQDADVVLMLSKLPPQEREGRENVVRLHVAKQRNGPTGQVDLLFEKNIQQFKNLMGGPGEVQPPPDNYEPDYEFEQDYDEDDTPF